MVLCSGYIWEPGEEGPTKYRVLDDDLLDVIKKGCADGIVVTVAGMLYDPKWEDFYRNFVLRLNRAGIRVQSYVAPRRNWHAKIAIRLCKDKPIAALIGSSNLTGPAYRQNWSRWNFESDVLIWPSNPELDVYFRGSKSNGGYTGGLDLILDPSVSQLTEQQQIQELYDDVITSDLNKFALE